MEVQQLIDKGYELTTTFGVKIVEPWRFLLSVAGSSNTSEI